MKELSKNRGTQLRRIFCEMQIPGGYFLSQAPILKKSLAQFLFDDFKSGSIMDVVPNLAICIASDISETLVKMGEIWADIQWCNRRSSEANRLRKILDHLG